MAGVSAGTVDRVLHNRGDVSVSSREKVQKVLDEIDYHPNMFAIGLAAKKRYHIVCIIPYYIGGFVRMPIVEIANSNIERP